MNTNPEQRTNNSDLQSPREHDPALAEKAAAALARGPYPTRYQLNDAKTVLDAVADDIARAERERVLTEVEALANDLMAVSPPEFDSKVERPEFAHTRCKLPGCNLRPWGLGTVTPDDPRYCVAHDRAAEVQVDLRALVARLRGGEPRV